MDVENEGDSEDNTMLTGDDVEPDEASTISPDADTQLLFVRPLYNPGSQLELP